MMRKTVSAVRGLGQIAFKLLVLTGDQDLCALLRATLHELGVIGRYLEGDSVELNEVLAENDDPEWGGELSRALPLGNVHLDP